jgi:hypothetical protein
MDVPALEAPAGIRAPDVESGTETGGLSEPPVPSDRPDDLTTALDARAAPPQVETVETAEDAADTAAETTAQPREELECRRRLASLGVTFTEHEPLSGAGGCRVAHPITVTGLPGGVKLQPRAVTNCATAEAAAKFVRDTVAPAALERFNSPLRTIGHASAYVCRPRNGTTKLSEHAFGNALDIASFGLMDGTRIEVRRHGSSEPRRKRFLREIREEACGPFKTVLGPGTDADHADHFHFDLAQRRNGGTYCR